MGGYATHVLVPHPRYLIDFDGIDPALAGGLHVFPGSLHSVL